MKLLFKEGPLDGIAVEVGDKCNTVFLVFQDAPEDGLCRIVEHLYSRKFTGEPNTPTYEEFFRLGSTRWLTP